MVLKMSIKGTFCFVHLVQQITYTMLYVWQLKCLVTFIEHLGPWTSTKVQMKRNILHPSWLHGVIPGVSVVVGKSLDRTSRYRMFVSRLYAINGGCLKGLAPPYMQCEM